MAANQRLYRKRHQNTKEGMDDHHPKGSNNGGNLQGGTISRLSMMYVQAAVGMLLLMSSMTRFTGTWNHTLLSHPNCYEKDVINSRQNLIHSTSPHSHPNQADGQRNSPRSKREILRKGNKGICNPASAPLRFVGTNRPIFTHQNLISRFRS